MYDEGVLFLVFMQEIGHLQAIGVSLSEQSRLRYPPSLQTVSCANTEKFLRM
jgi:hypothetical protein